MLEYERGADRLSESLRRQIERGRKTLAFDYLHAAAQIPRLNDGFREVFDRYDAIVTPAAPGPAPRGLESTGDPALALPWTHAGLPAISLPAGTDAAGWPLGLQVVGPFGADEELLAVTSRPSFGEACFGGNSST